MTEQNHESFVQGEGRHGIQHESHGANSAEHDAVHSPETAEEVQDARNAAIERRTPPDTSADPASPDSGKPGAVPSPSPEGSPSDPDTPLNENPAYQGDPYNPADD